jgi:hypothetical protein
MVDHYNGLLLYSNGYPLKLTVVNPATWQWEHLPQILADNHEAYLMFDPAILLGVPDPKRA